MIETRHPAREGTKFGAEEAAREDEGEGALATVAVVGIRTIKAPPIIALLFFLIAIEEKTSRRKRRRLWCFPFVLNARSLACDLSETASSFLLRCEATKRE